MTELNDYMKKYLQLYPKDDRLKYHNKDHVERCLAVIPKIVQFEYEMYEIDGLTPEQLQWAIIFHDWVYDENPSKEFRSAQYATNALASMTGVTSNTSREKIHTMIMSTTTHSLTDWPKYCTPMMKADLFDLTDAYRTIQNWENIREESILLYGIDNKEFAKNNIKFMRKLDETMMNNFHYSKDYFWKEVSEGINLTIKLSKHLLEEEE